VPQAPTQPRETAEPLDDEDEEMEHELPKEIKIAEQIGEFDEVVVWGHGGTVDEGSDMFVRGVREWVGFAESMHCDEEGEEGQSNAVETS
jgi:ribonuclease H2 subunit C